MKDYCPKCKKIKGADQFQRNDKEPWCDPCLRENFKMGEEKASQRALAKASRELTRAIQEARAARQEADIPQIINHFKEKIGGNEALAEFMAEDFKRLRGVGLPPEAKEDFIYKESLIQRYHQMIWKQIGAKDELVSNMGDLGDLDEQDLRAVLMPLAAQMLHDDPEFRREIFLDVIRDDKDLLLEAMRESGIEVIDMEEEDGHPAESA